MTGRSTYEKVLWTEGRGRWRGYILVRRGMLDAGFFGDGPFEGPVMRLSPDGTLDVCAFTRARLERKLDLMIERDRTRGSYEKITVPVP